MKGEIDLLKSMNEAMDYIELHLYDEVEESELERITGTSVYHFRRMFSFLSGMTLGSIFAVENYLMLHLIC